MTQRDEITEFCNDYLSLHNFPDYGPMGAQFLGSENVSKVASAVSVSKDVIQRAADSGADLLVVHHGMFWNNESRVLDSRVGGRLEALEKHGITLLACHLALDAHPKIGNNILAARALGLGHLTPWQDIGWSGEYREPMTDHEFTAVIVRQFNLSLGDISHRYYFGDKIHKVAVIVGGAPQYIVQAHRDGFDTFLTGEAAEPTLALASDLKMNFVAAGHDKTERSGVQQLGRAISKKFHIPHEFIRVENPV